MVKPKATVSVTLPKNSTAATTPASFVTAILKNLSDEKLKDLQAAVEKQQPEIEQQIKKLAPLIKDIEHKAASLSDEINHNYIIPAAVQENDGAKQIVVREEQSGSKNAMVKVYTLSFTNGKWELHPEWKLAAKENAAADSLRNTDTSIPLNNLQTAY